MKISEPDGLKKTAKWKSAWDLTERGKEKLQKKKKKLKKKKSLLSQGFLDLINMNSDKEYSDNNHNNVQQTRIFNNKQVTIHPIRLHLIPL